MKNWFGSLIARMTGAQAEKDAVVAKIKARDEQITKLENEIASLKESKVSGETAVKAKEEKISTLEKEIDSLNKLKASEDKAIKHKDNQIAALEAKIAELEGKLSSVDTETQNEEELEPEVDISSSRKVKGKASKTDPYQQIGEELVKALKVTTKGGSDNTKKDK